MFTIGVCGVCRVWHSSEFVSWLVCVPGRTALQCFTVRCAAVAARIEDPYIDTTMKV